MAGNAGVSGARCQKGHQGRDGGSLGRHAGQTFIRFVVVEQELLHESATALMSVICRGH